VHGHEAAIGHAASSAAGFAAATGVEQTFASAQFFAQRLRQVIVRPYTSQGLPGHNALLPLNARSSIS
jgi:hypothetical protein